MAYGKTKKWMIGGAALAGTAVLTAALWQGLTLRRYALHTDKLSAPVRLLLLTDLHSTFYGRRSGGCSPPSRPRRPTPSSWRGTWQTTPRGDAGVDALMSALGGAYPCCYVSGNHEVRTGCLEALKRRSGAGGHRAGGQRHSVGDLPGGTTPDLRGGRPLRLCRPESGGWSSSGPARR